MASSLDVRTTVASPGEPDRPDETEGDGAAWGMLWILIGFKAFSIALILFLHTSDVSLTMMLWLNWPWWALIVFLVGGLGLAHWRLWRVRLKRRQLVHSEWNVAPDYNDDMGRVG